MSSVLKCLIKEENKLIGIFGNIYDARSLYGKANT